MTFYSAFHELKVAPSKNWAAPYVTIVTHAERIALLRPGRGTPIPFQSLEFVAVTRSLEYAANFLTTELHSIPSLMRDSHAPSLCSKRFECLHRPCRFSTDSAMRSGNEVQGFSAIVEKLPLGSGGDNVS